MDKFLNFLESSKKIEAYQNLKQGESVLIIGDGVSHAYSHELLNKYNNIITVNMGIYDKNIPFCHNRFHLAMGPKLMYPKFFSRNKHCQLNGIKNKIISSKLEHVFVSSLGRFFEIIKRGHSNIKYISPYHRIIKNEKLIYDDFTSALQSALGLAILLGFSKVDLIGFEAWTLFPKNDIRWYTDTADSKYFDIYERALIPNFLRDASELVDLNAYTYNHYKSAYKEINSIPLHNKSYNPGNDRNHLISKFDLEMLMKCDYFNQYQEHQ